MLAARYLIPVGNITLAFSGLGYNLDTLKNLTLYINAHKEK